MAKKTYPLRPRPEPNPLRRQRRLFSTDHNPFTATAPTNPRAEQARRLAQEAARFRAVHGYWGLSNVASMEYEMPDGRCVIINVVAGQGLHAEDFGLYALSQLREWERTWGPPNGRPRALYTELEPCDLTAAGTWNDPDNYANREDCRTRLAASPLTEGMPIYYSFNYEGDTRKQGIAALQASLVSLQTNEATLRTQAQTALQQGAEVIDILPVGTTDTALVPAGTMAIPDRFNYPIRFNAVAR